MNKKVYDGSVERLRRPERVERMAVDKVVDTCLGQSNFKTVLDCGTGSGVFAEAFFKRGLKVSGVDLNPDMIEAAKQFVLDGEFKIGQLEKLPFSDNSFDLVFYAHSLHEADNLNIVLSEAKRVTKSYVIALEWPFRFKLHGSPIWHRIRVSQMKREVKRLGFQKLIIENINDQNLFILQK